MTTDLIQRVKKTEDGFSDIGNGNALSVIEDWLRDEHLNVRRAVTEGLRI